MKLFVPLLVIVIIGITINCEAFPMRQRMVYYHPSRSWYAAPQRLMYLQYQHVRPSKTHSRSTQATAALVAGDTVATGSYLNDCHNTPSEDAVSPLEDDPNDTDGHISQSVAEAYPDQSEFEIPNANNDSPYAFHQPNPTYDAAVENLIPNSSPEHDQDSNGKYPLRDYNYEKGIESTIKPETVDVPISNDELPKEISTIQPILQVKPIRKHKTTTNQNISPSKRYLPAKKKVIIDLEEEEDEEENEENEEEQDNVNVEDESSLDEYDPLPDDRSARIPSNPRKPNKVGKKPLAKKPSKGKVPLPTGTFFPINFGGTSGGAIAIANSFSTGEGGSATSHAVAYGSPDAVRSRLRPTKVH